MKLKSILEAVLLVIERNSNIKVSFGVYDGIKSLAQNNVRLYRGLRVLKDVKSSFNPTFADTDKSLLPTNETTLPGPNE